MRALILASLIAACASVPAYAQSLQIRGKIGYLGEYELAADVAAKASGNEKELVGPMTISHVGICVHDGPNQTNGQINIKLSGDTSQATITFLFEGRKCTYNGIVSKLNVGKLVCPSGSLPFSVWLK